MNDNIMKQKFDITTLIGETSAYEKKQELELKKVKSWCKTISAFANGTGGILIFGIADDDTLVGLADAKGDAEKISEAIKTHIDPIPEFDLSFAKADGKDLIVLTLMPGAQTPYYYIGDGQQQTFVRVGNESVVASPMKHKDLVLRGSNITYDSIASQWKFDDMAFTVLRAAYFNRSGHSFENSDYLSFGIVNEKGELTNAGALLADYSPVRHSRLFCTRWNGVDKAHGVMDALDDEEYSGSLVTLLQAGLNFVSRNTKKAWRKTADKRLEYPEYPERAIEEGLVNALIHRSYLELGSEVHIDMYDDRLEIFSPGGLMDGGSISLMDIMNMSSRRRNPVLADIFSRLKYMERRGSGFRKILAAYKEHDGYTAGMEPTFATPWDSFVLTLPKFNVIGVDGVYLDEESNEEIVQGSNQEATQKEQNTTQKTAETTQKEQNTTQKNQETTQKITELQKAILDFLRKDPKASRKIMMQEIDGITEDGIKYNLKILQNKGLLKRVGPDKGGHWEVIK